MGCALCRDGGSHFIFCVGSAEAVDVFRKNWLEIDDDILLTEVGIFLVGNAVHVLVGVGIEAQVLQLRQCLHQFSFLEAHLVKRLRGVYRDVEIVSPTYDVGVGEQRSVCSSLVTCILAIKRCADGHAQIEHFHVCQAWCAFHHQAHPAASLVLSSSLDGET